MRKTNVYESHFMDEETEAQRDSNNLSKVTQLASSVDAGNRGLCCVPENISLMTPLRN